jgi:O-antigen ligase
VSFPAALAPFIPYLGIVAAAATVACVFAFPSARGRAIAAIGALFLAPVLLVGEVWESPGIESLRDRPVVLVGAAVAGAIVVAVLAAVFAVRPWLMPLFAFAALPFRIPVETGGDTANLLVPLYVVVGAGVAAYAWVRLAGTRPGWVKEPERPRRVEIALAAVVLIYALQAGYSTDFEQAIKNVSFFYIPFALLLKLLTAVEWTKPLAIRCLAITVGLAVCFAAIGFWEYQARELLWNAKVSEANQLESYFRVNSLFFDPNIYGRYLAIVMIALAAVLLWQKRPRDTLLTALILAVLWGGLVLTFSQTSFAALFIGLIAVACVRWRPAPILIGVATIGVTALIVALAAPGAVGIDTDEKNPLDEATTGRFGLLEGGLRMFADRPIWGYGSGSFGERYRDREDVTSRSAAVASHTTPMTVAAEQGLIGLIAYGALLFFAFKLLFERLRWTSRRGPPSLPPLGRTIVAAGFTALVAHTMGYAAFLEDPITWTLIGVGIALRFTPSASSTSSDPVSVSASVSEPSARTHTARTTP